ncbi:MAG: glycoside hydrolase family 3 N-terminal domain-containing protein [Tepidiformaceae bacterium]
MATSRRRLSMPSFAVPLAAVTLLAGLGALAFPTARSHASGASDAPVTGTAGLAVRAYVPGVAYDGAPAPPSTCIDVAAWDSQRLAAETVVVPVQESDVRAVEEAVANGAGGVILFGSTAPGDLRTQIDSLESAVPGQLGLLVMTDEEGGGVQRMANLVGNLPWPRDMAAMWTPEEITANVEAVAKTMAGYGVNMNLAPVIDVDGSDVAPGSANPDGWRSFGGDTSVVTRDGIAFMKGLQAGGVIPVLKHFPGLGGATGNTDNGPAQTLPWATLQETALPPFIEGIREGAPAIMISNAVVPGLTELPASLSPEAIQGELVDTLQFKGLILTDSLSAGAISAAGFSGPSAAVRAVGAGADMVLYGAGNSQAAIAQFHAIVSAETSAVANGTLPRSRLVAAATAALDARNVETCP